jgi:hypothetical protein
MSVSKRGLKEREKIVKSKTESVCERENRKRERQRERER